MWVDYVDNWGGGGGGAKGMLPHPSNYWVLLIWISVGQGPTVLPVGAGGPGLFGHFSLVSHFSLRSPSLWETVRYRLKYCLRGPFSPKPTNQFIWVEACPLPPSSYAYVSVHLSVCCLNFIQVNPV